MELYKWAFLGLKYAYLDSIDYEVENEAFKQRKDYLHNILSFDI
ncbi:hypothetical protein ACSW9N_02050 [Clostridium perfringens]|nr:hypothetical protein [Clostridium perfringens]MDT7917798.1 hypothetical protein [Clostridium perfringens]MDT7937390.1 hypothetical protein [Clostridium perfringens]MDT7940671.1 hypothetical protein [Clostridium perfringens]MDT7966529.1 hypothetical protein [Clostridium perfringens]MDT7991218.1 hypothetical protein [Clostridium perfringens]